MTKSSFGNMMWYTTLALFSLSVLAALIVVIYGGVTYLAGDTTVVTRDYFRFSMFFAAISGPMFAFLWVIRRIVLAFDNERH